MAEASSSRRPRKSGDDGDDDLSEDERKYSIGASSRRQSHYSSQRVSRSTRPTTSSSHQYSKSRDKQRASYQEPASYGYLDETAVPVPVDNPEDSATYRRRASLEENMGRRPKTRDGAQPKDDAPDRRPSARRRRNVRTEGEEGEDLTEVAAPPPIQKSLGDDREGDLERQQFLEDEERGREPRDEESESPPYGQKKPGDYADGEKPVPKLLTELFTISYLIFFSIMGTLARLGVQWLTFYPGTPIVTPVIWANFGGSMIMGFLAEDQGLFRNPDGNELSDSSNNEASNEKGRRQSKIAEDLAATAKAAHTKRKKAIPLFIGLATGFCGSFTSFSSFARDFFLALANHLPTPIDHPYGPMTANQIGTTIGRNGGYSFEALLHVIMVTIALSLGGLIAGAQIAIFADPITPRIHGSFIRNFVDPAMVVLGFGCWLGAVFLAIFPPHEMWRGEVVFALVFAPLGCLLRFYVSMWFNPLVPAYPLGTFAVNMFGTAIEGMCYDIQHVRVGLAGQLGGGVVGCQVLQGIMDGFCGCLTTVSTWVAEINGLKRKHGWGYAFGSVLGGFCLLVVIMGSVVWSVGYHEPMCNTGYTSKVHG